MGEDLRTSILQSCLEVGRPILFGIGIIITVYVPILTLEGVEGKLFRPIALTVVFALVGSLLLTFSVTPVLMSLLLKHPREDQQAFLIRKAKQWYEPILRWSLQNPWSVVAAALAVVAIMAGVAPFLGSEFIPRLDEGAIAIGVRRLPSVALPEAISQAQMLETRLVQRLPDEITTVVSKTGRAEITTDPMDRR